MRVKHIVLRLLGVLILVLSLSAGSCPGGRNPDRFGLVANITGPPNEVISLQVAPFEPLCCSTSDGCKGSQTVILDHNGFARVTRLVNPSTVVVTGQNTRCQGAGQWPPGASCPPQAISIDCIVIQQSQAPTGKITITGSGVECTYVSGRRICNNTRVYVTINEVTVSTLATEFDTPSNVAQDLASAINNHSTLSQLVVASASGATVSVTARSEGVDFNYPWQTSCSYNRIYFSGCGYQGEVAPVATLHPLAP